LIKHTDESHADYPHLQEAFGKIEAVVTSVNEKKQADEDREVIARIISRLSNTEVRSQPAFSLSLAFALCRCPSRMPSS
jgi:hypothetical protein